MHWFDFILLFAFGVMGGFLAGLLGIGGGIVYITVLRFYVARYGVTDEAAVKFILSNALVGSCVAGISGTLRQASHKYFFPREILITGVSAIVATLCVTASIVQWNWYSAERFNIFFFFVMLFIAANFLILKPKHLEIVPVEKDTQLGKVWPKLVLTGLLTGVFSALSGLGGGVVLILMLIKFLHYDVRKAAAISLGCIPIQAMASGLYYGISSSPHIPQLPLTFGYLILPILAPLLAGVVIGSPLGVRQSHKTSPAIIRIIFVVIILFISIQTIYEHFKG